MPIIVKKYFNEFWVKIYLDIHWVTEISRQNGSLPFFPGRSRGDNLITRSSVPHVIHIMSH